MTHWLAYIPHLPTWTGWPTLAAIANGEKLW